MSTPSSNLPDWKQTLISHTLSSSILTFGEFTLKSGRVSPYFINCGLFSTSNLINALGSAYARTIDDYARENTTFQCDVLFGPAYKGIPFAVATAMELGRISAAQWGEVGFAFNRKEVKDHGEGGIVVGADMRGKRVVIVDDVMTSGKAVREAVDIIAKQGGTLVGIVVAVDREEKMPSKSEREGNGDDGGERGSAIAEVRRETGVPVLAVLTLRDIMRGMEELGRGKEVEAMREYYLVYGAKD